MAEVFTVAMATWPLDLYLIIYLIIETCTQRNMFINCPIFRFKSKGGRIEFRTVGKIEEVH